MLYRRAFEDYQCTKLWPGYLETLEESLDVSALSSLGAMAFIALRPGLGSHGCVCYRRFAASSECVLKTTRFSPLCAFLVEIMFPPTKL